MMDQWHTELELALVNSKVLCIALFKSSGELIFANKAMKMLFKGDPIESFINPRIENLLKLSENEDFNGFITIGNENTSNISIQASASQKNEEMLIRGELDIMQLSKQNVSFSKLLRENSNLQRALIKEKKLLQINEKRLEELNESQNTLLGTAAHDLRNPIGTAFSFAELLTSNFDDFSKEELLQHLKNIQDTTRFSLNLLNSLLDLSKIKSGKIELETKAMNYLDVVHESVLFNSLFAKNKNITIELIKHIQSIQLEIDQLRITQALNNLISNAIKFSDQYTNILVIISPEKDMLKTEIIDQGQGINPDEIHSLFEPFQTTSSLPTGGEKSTGLGLAIVKKVIELHHGKLEVFSEKGKGSNFTFWLPSSSTS